MDTQSIQPSEGEFRVRTTFNPSNDSIIDQIKQKGADLINLVDSLQPKDESDKRNCASLGRLKSLAMTEIESGTSWAFKAATTFK